jgi:hypothetical protein
MAVLSISQLMVCQWAQSVEPRRTAVMYCGLRYILRNKPSSDGLKSSGSRGRFSLRWTISRAASWNMSFPGETPPATFWSGPSGQATTHAVTQITSNISRSRTPYICGRKVSMLKGLARHARSTSMPEAGGTMVRSSFRRQTGNSYAQQESARNYHRCTSRGCPGPAVKTGSQVPDVLHRHGEPGCGKGSRLFNLRRIFGKECPQKHFVSRTCGAR